MIDNENKSFSFSIHNNLEVFWESPLYVPPCDVCDRTTIRDDVDVQCVGRDTGEFIAINEYTGEEIFADEWLCKEHREKFNRPAITSYKKQDIGKSETYVQPTFKEIEFDVF